VTDTPIPQSIGRPAARTALFAVLAYCAFDLLLPLIPIRLHHLPLGVLAALAVVPTAVFMLLQLWLSHSLVGLRSKPASSLALTIGGVLLWLAITFFMPVHQRFLVFVLKQTLQGLFITVTCTFSGILLSRIVREANILLPVAVIAMPIDYLGAMTNIGFTNNVVNHHPEIVRAVSVPVPAITGLPIFPFVGPGDALFMAFFFAVVLRLNMNDRGTFWWMYGLLMPALIAVILLPHFAVAALVPMGLAVLIANIRFFRLKRDEAFAVLYASLLVLVLVVGFYLYSHSHFFRH
jgi:hypothetical protein